MKKRRSSRKVKIGNLSMGGDAPISVQSMCSTKTSDVDSTLKQIDDLLNVGCELIRLAIPDIESAKALADIRKEVDVPLVADIHFDYRLALESAKYVDKLRINPGNIGDDDKVKAVVNEAKDRGLPIRIGVNSGSLEKHIQNEFGCNSEALVRSAMHHIKILENNDFYDTVISMKSSNVSMMMDAYRKISDMIDYPLHLGVTEAGPLMPGAIKSSIGIGLLLSEGIGDTIRVSLSAEPRKEVSAGFTILKAMGLRNIGREIISCPTCGRTDIDVVALAEKVEEATMHILDPIKIAVMGCVVNGPGEAKEADYAVVGGKGEGFIYRKGELLRKVEEKDIIGALLEEVDKRR